MPMVLLETEWDAVVVVSRVAFAQFILRKEFGDFFSNIDYLYLFSYRAYYSNRTKIIFEFLFEI